MNPALDAFCKHCFSAYSSALDHFLESGKTHRKFLVNGEDIDMEKHPDFQSEPITTNPENTT